MRPRSLEILNYLLLTGILAACAAPSSGKVEGTQAADQVTSPAALRTPPATQLIEATQPSTPMEQLRPEARVIQFQTADGNLLVGRYYPSSVNPAPVVVLMHWAGGDQQDWMFLGMAAWLQNRNQIPYEPERIYPFDTPYEFPRLPEERSYAVFTFDFRGFGESPGPDLGFEQKRALWVLDAQAAYAVARSLSGVDPRRVYGIGASIGADAVVEACGEVCSGALSLGPGNYLGVDYAQAAQTLVKRGASVWCVGAKDDPPAVTACEGVGEMEGYSSLVYPRGGHAMALFRGASELDPSLGQVVYEWLEAVVK